MLNINIEDLKNENSRLSAFSSEELEARLL